MVVSLPILNRFLDVYCANLRFFYEIWNPNTRFSKHILAPEGKFLLEKHYLCSPKKQSDYGTEKISYHAEGFPDCESQGRKTWRDWGPRMSYSDEDDDAPVEESVRPQPSKKSCHQEWWQLFLCETIRKAEEKWGTGIVEQLSIDLQASFPGSKGFSTTNLWYMKQWYLFYSGSVEKLHQVGGEFQNSEIQADKKLQQVVEEINVCRRKNGTSKGIPRKKRTFAALWQIVIL